MIDFSKIKKIYFVGIGGISMSALAKLMKHKGKEVCGCDDNLSQITKNLENCDIIVKQKIFKQGLKECDLVVYTNAINKGNENLILAKKLNKQIIERAEFLGEICKMFKTVIAVCGTHGKTTTTAMLFDVLSNKNPTVHIGGITQNINNMIVGNDELFITEACEYNKSFLHISPTYTIVTNIEPDHMDCYQNFEELKQTFYQFILKTKEKTIINQKFLNFYDINFANKKILSFSLNKNSTTHVQNIKEKNGRYSFEVIHKNKTMGKINLQVFGLHNVYNALAVISLCLELKIDFRTIQKKLKTFQNVKRRFEIKYKKEITIISDYAHHPTEIKATIETAKNLKHNKLICVFQPHTYSRTKTLFPEFLKCFNKIDKLFLLKTYEARETPIEGGSSYDLFLGLKQKINVNYFENINQFFEELNKNIEKNDIVLFLGAGTIDGFCDEFIKKYYLA